MATTGKRRLADTADRRPDADDLRALHAGLCLLRTADAAAGKLAREGKTGLHVSSEGLEAVLGGTASALLPTDWVLPGVRQSPIALARGFNPISWFAQRLGRIADPTRGRQEPGHLAVKNLNVASVSTRPGTQLVHATGVAHAMKRAGRGEVAVALCGHGAVATDDFHTGLNFAAVWQVPVVFVVDSTDDLSTQTASVNVAIKADAYGMPSTEVDGGDVLAVRQAVSDALAHARAGNGPTLVEARCGRPQAASSIQPLRLVEDGETAWADPLLRFGEKLVEAKLLDDASSPALLALFEEQMEAAAKTALALPSMPPSTLLDDVFASQTPALKHQLKEWRHATSSRHPGANSDVKKDR
jgi:TPP-dependent pyruvate/acetoin dehydrogenase alpha subunit